jgi:WD40 repeat protein
VVALLALAGAAAAQPPRTDAFGDPLPPFAVARAGTVRLRHSLPVTAVACSPDGKLLVSGDEGGALRLWDAATGAPLRDWQPLKELRSPVTALAVSPDGTQIAVGFAGQPVALFQTATLQWRQPQEPSQGISYLCFAPDGKAVACFTRDKQVRLLDVATGKLGPGLAPVAPVEALWFSPDGTRFTTLRADGVLEVRTVAAGKLVRTVNVNVGVVRAAAFAPDGKHLACALPDGEIVLCDAATGKRVRQFCDDELSVRLTFSPDGKRLAAASWHWLRVWDVATGKEVNTVPNPNGTPHRPVFTAGGQGIAHPRGHAVAVWEAAAPRERLLGGNPTMPIRVVAASTAGRTVAATSYFEKGVRLWDAVTGKPRAVLDPDDLGVYGFVLSPRGDVFAAAGERGGLYVAKAGAGAELMQVGKHEQRVIALAYSGDGAVLASADREHSVRLWQVAGKKQTRRFDFKDFSVQAVGLSPDGRRLAALGNMLTKNAEVATECRIWDVESGRQRVFRPAQEEEAAAPPTALVFSPDGWLFATADSFLPSTNVRVHEATTGTLLWSVQGQPGMFDEGDFKGFAFAPDSRTLVLAYRERLRVLDACTGAERRQVPCPAGAFTSLVSSADGRTLTTGSTDTTALVWDAAALTRFPVTPRSQTAADLARAWATLGEGKPAEAFAAMHALEADPKQTLAWLHKHLRPVKVLDEQAALRWLAALDDRRFAAREQARQALETAGEAAVPYLQKRLAENPPLEMRRRIELLLARCDPDTLGGATLQALRGVLVLERMGTPGARQLLQTLAAGAPGTLVTREAQAALLRLTGS